MSAFLAHRMGLIGDAQIFVLLFRCTPPMYLTSKPHQGVSQAWNSRVRGLGGSIATGVAGHFLLLTGPACLQGNATQASNAKKTSNKYCRTIELSAARAPRGAMKGSATDA